MSSANSRLAVSAPWQSALPHSTWVKSYMCESCPRKTTHMWTMPINCVTCGRVKPILCEHCLHQQIHIGTLQQTETHCNTLQHNATHCAVHYNIMQWAHRIRPHFRLIHVWYVLQCVAVCCSVLQCVACANRLRPHCTSPHHTAPHYTTLHHIAPHCTIMVHAADSDYLSSVT